ncbi:pore-forming ESAT-6 family protein [Bacillus haimaensis]|jgi:WXG100 family type VII secretion target|uniref:ESAT-6-like protein n=1 Tax=Sutcliffiella tianshenii TaxID=1463404 RepID=A0ABS2NV76_9BACI|nr:pore-forming ESAT-6 family protein [Bacillus tianshenii]MBM7618443.1 WXG100 family type VII secretion target [Bacillus tianshenii]MCA1320433.1 pore-forming ESAT-6 family protein [Bacillus tianshenii]
MSVDGIKISLGEVSKTAGQIRTLNAQLAAKLEEIKKEMNGLSQTWNSDASNTIRTNFNALAPRFEEYRTVVDAYSKFLDSTVTNYNSAETQINNNASAFR